MLTELLLSQALGTGLSRLQPQVHPSIQHATWAPVEAARALLSPTEADTMANVDVQPSGLPFGFYTQQKQASVDRTKGSPTIQLMSDATTFKDAQQGNPNAVKQLAALLMHEQTHINQGANEAPAYDAQLEILKRLMASPSTIADVQHARDSVVRK